MQKKVIPMGEQIQQFTTVHGNLSAVLGRSTTQYVLAKSVFFITVGSNDILTYYYSNVSTPFQEFIATLGYVYEGQIKVTISLLFRIE